MKQHDMKRGFPEAGILLIGVGDHKTSCKAVNCTRCRAFTRSSNTNKTWRLKHALPSGTSMRAWAVKAVFAAWLKLKPAEAGKDYTHINHRGGQRIARTLYKSLVYGYEQYQHHANQTSNR